MLGRRAKEKKRVAHTKRKQWEQKRIPEEGGDEKFTCEFHSSFRGIGLSLCVDDEGRLMIQEVKEGGEAGKYPGLQQGLHIVAVGIAEQKESRAADELLQQFMSLPRPVRVQFATIPASAAPLSSSPSTEAATRSRNLSCSAHTDSTTARTLQVDEVHSESEEEDRNERSEDEGSITTSKTLSRKSEAVDHETGTTIEERVRAEQEDHQQEDNVNDHENQRPLATVEESNGRGDHESLRPQRHGMISDAGRDNHRADADDEGQRRSRGEWHGKATDEEGERSQHLHNEQSFTETNEGRCHEQPRGPLWPQRHGTLLEDGDWENNLRIGRGVAVASHLPPSPPPPPPLPVASATATGGVVIPALDVGEATWSIAEETTVRSSPTNGSHSPTRSFHSPNARRSQLGLTPDGSDSSMWSRALTDGVDSMRRWLHDDSDDSEGEGKTASPRHSWYTTNRMRGGHASDVNYSTPFTRAAALAKARAAEQSLAGSEAGAASGKESMAPAKQPFVVDAKSVATPVSMGRGKGGQLPNAVIARQHRSPSWYQQSDGGRGCRLVGGDILERSKVGDIDRGPGGRVDVSNTSNAKEPTNAARNPAAAISAGPATKAIVGNLGEEGEVSKTSRSPNPVPRTGGVSARLHYSPSSVLKGGAGLFEENVSRAKVPSTARSAVRNTLKQTAHNAVDSTCQTPCGLKSQEIARPSNADTTPRTSAPAASRWASNDKTKNIEGKTNPSSILNEVAALSKSKAVSERVPRVRTGRACMTDTATRVTASGNQSFALAKGANRGSDKIGTGVDGVGVPQQSSMVGRSTSHAPATTAAVNNSQSSETDASFVDAQQWRAEDGLVRNSKTECQHEHQRHGTSSDKVNSNNRGGDTRQHNVTATHSSGKMNYCGENGFIAGSMQNYKPFSQRPSGRRMLSEGPTLGRGRSRPLRPSFFLALPEEDEPPPPPPPPPPAPLHGWRPSVGPVNPRAMYGHSPPTLGDTRQDRQIGPPSIVVIPPEHSLDKNSVAKDLNLVERNGSRGAACRPFIDARTSGSIGANDEAARYEVPSKERKCGADRKPPDSALSMSITAMRKSESAPGQRERSNKSIGRGSGGPAHKARRACSTSLLSNAGQGTVKVEKVQLTLNKARSRRDATVRRGDEYGGRVKSRGQQRLDSGAYRATHTRSKMPRQKMGMGDKASPHGVAHSGVEELSKLAIPGAADREDVPSCQDKEEEEEEEGEDEEDVASVKNVRGKSEKLKSEGPSKRTASWERQLRTMAGVGLSPVASNTGRRLQRNTAKHRRSSLCTEPGSGRGRGGEAEGVGGGGGEINNLAGSESREKNIEVANTASSSDAAKKTLDSTPATPVETNAPLTEWDHLKIEVGNTQQTDANARRHQPTAAEKHEDENGSVVEHEAVEHEALAAARAAVSEVGGARGRSSTGSFRASSTVARTRPSSRSRSSSAVQKPTTAAATAATTAAVAAAAAAVTQLRKKGKMKTAARASEVHVTEAAKTAAAAAAAAEAAAAAALATSSSDSGGDGVRIEQKISAGPAVVRVCVRVRSSIYLIVAEVKKDGSALLDQVVEAEKLRHGKKAAKVTGLKNESTGDTVDMNVPVERSVCSGDSLTALVAGQNVRVERPSSPPPGIWRDGTKAVDCEGGGENHGGTLTSTCTTITSSEIGTSSSDKRERGRTAQRNAHINFHDYNHNEDQGVRNAPSPHEKSRPSPLRKEYSSRGDHGGGLEGDESPRRSEDVEQLREDIARHLYKERLMAGGGAGAADSPTRSIGSPAITPVTAGGRGASPEHPRSTSPRSESPRGALKGRGRSIRDVAKAGAAPGEVELGKRRSRSSSPARSVGKERSRPGSPTRSVCSATSGYTHCSGFSVRSHGRGGVKGAAGNQEAVFMTQSTLTPEELDGILKEELLKSRKWSARHRTAQDKICRVWEERGAKYARMQQEYQEAEASRQEKARQRRELEAAQATARARQRSARAQSVLQQARSARGNRESRAKEAEEAHRRRMRQISDKREREQRKHATKVQDMDRRREDVRDSFLDMVDAENETAIQALETPLEMLDRALEEGDELAEKKARRAMLKQAARERVQVREKAARVLADQRRLELKNNASYRSRQLMESSMMPGPGQYNLRDFSELGGGAYSHPLA